jgi:hypothetical protein
MGFKTDIRDDGVVCHVQTEPRKDAAIETTGHTRGAVIHKLKSSYQDLPNSPDYNEDMVKRALEDQHRQVMTRIGAGEIVPPPSPSAPFQS